MKYTVLGTIIAIHAIAILIFLGPCSANPKAPASEKVGATEDPQADMAPGSDATGHQPSPTQSSRKKHPSTFAHDFFTPSHASPPQKLRARLADCRNGVLVDWTQRRLHWMKGETTAVPIASLTKMMTVNLLMQDLRSRADLTLQTPVRVTVDAYRIGGRQVWLDPKETFTLDELLKCVMIRSANDCAYLVGQFLGGGDHAVFVERMNRTAGELGLGSMKFYNTHGLPSGAGRSENKGSAVELAYLAGLLLQYPEVVKWSSTRVDFIREDTKPFRLVNTNTLLEKVSGVNGMKTGLTNKSGYCLAVTCERNGRIMIAVVLGCSSKTKRGALAEALLEWGYAQP